MAEDILSDLDIQINGSRPWDLHVHDERIYDRVLRHGTLGLGESYMDGWWDVERLDQFFYRVLRSGLKRDVRRNWRTRMMAALQLIVNQQRRARAFKVGEHHYDCGNDLYRAMLDKRMVYTCAYWKDATNLDDAQEAKLELVCRKINLEKGQRVLDIGCGWGSFLKYAAERHGAIGVGINNSKEQTSLGRSMCADWPVEIRLRDYRDITDEYDHVVSLGMFEHVGPKNYRTYMEIVHRHLKDDGFFLLQTIGCNKPLRDPDLWTEKYTFPGGVLPAIGQIGRAIEGLFVLEDWHSLGSHYDKTSMAWFGNVDAHWPELRDQYGDRFYRMWKYFLLAMAGSFRARQNQLWQIVLSKRGVQGGYDSVR